MSACQATPASRSLIYGLELLALFDSEHPVRGISELAELLGVSRPTAHRYATTCLELGYLEQAPMRRYRLAQASAETGASRPRAPAIAGRGRYSRSLARGLAILGCFTSERPLLGVAEIADRLGMSRASTHRYLRTLLKLGYLEQDGSRKYRLGPRALSGR